MSDMVRIMIKNDYEGPLSFTEKIEEQRAKKYPQQYRIREVARETLDQWRQVDQAFYEAQEEIEELFDKSS